MRSFFYFQSEIESLVQARRRELLGESVDDNDADSCEGSNAGICSKNSAC